jgi:hypothetical protein
MRDSHRKVAAPGRLLSRSLAFACLASLLLGSRSEASVEILVWGQNTGSNTFTLKNSSTAGHPGMETITGTNVPVLITTLDGLSVPGLPASMTFSATSIPGTTTGSNTAGSTLSEQFSGSFSITAPGINYLSGTFTDIFTGKFGAKAAGLSVSMPPDTLSFNSSIPGLPTGAPNTFSLAFTNLSHALKIVNGSIGVSGTTTMAMSGNASASPSAVPEPSTFVVAAIGGLGLIGYGLRRRRTLGA